MDYPDGVPEGVLWWTFEDQTVVGHTLALLVGVGTWFGVYLFLLEEVGTLEYATLDTPTAIDARYTAWQAASTACWLWFSVAIVLGKGGPFRNGITYPLTLTLVGPWVVSLGLFRSMPHGMHTTAVYMSPGYVHDGYMLVFPGALLAMFVVGVFAALLRRTGRLDDWVERHMPEEWHDIDPEATPFGGE